MSAIGVSLNKISYLNIFAATENLQRLGYMSVRIHLSMGATSNSATIRVPKRDKERLERLAKKTCSKRLSEAFRFALSSAERETDRFRGNVEALAKAHRSVCSVGGNVSENIDEVLAESLRD